MTTPVKCMCPISLSFDSFRALNNNSLCLTNINIKLNTAIEEARHCFNTFLNSFKGVMMSQNQFLELLSLSHITTKSYTK